MPGIPRAHKRQGRLDEPPPQEQSSERGQPTVFTTLEVGRWLTDKGMTFRLGSDEAYAAGFEAGQRAGNESAGS